MLRAVIIWWLAQLRSLLPPRWQDRGPRPRDGLVADCGVLGAPPGPVTLLHRRRGRERPADPLDGKRQSPCVVRLDGRPLQRDLVMPNAIEPDITQVLSNDMGRLAPFDAADLFWAWRVTQRDPVRKRLTVHLWYVPRRMVQPLLERLAEQGLAPAELEFVAPGGTMRLPLAPRTSRRLASWLGVAAASVLLALLAVPFVQQSMEMAGLDADLAARQPAAERVQRLRDRLAAHAPSATASAAEARRIGDVLQALATITDGLPDSTTLADLTFRQRRLTLTGSSERAAQLVADLSAQRLIRDPVFVAPIVHDLATARDSFSLRAELAP